MIDFEFSKNTSITALVEPKKIGRPFSEEPPRNKHVSAYLSDEEYQCFIDRLDGRPASSVVRRLILDHMSDDEK